MADNEAVFERVLRAGGERYLPDTPPKTFVPFGSVISVRFGLNLSKPEIDGTPMACSNRLFGVFLHSDSK